ncbi:MAG: 2-oxoacid:acceptor oxidoreductase family protein, partial [Phycisphaerales bacterium]|nr:2-oxoacid:acceptor oxidoreductase family protein [Phycisphaerales bacterium]
KLYVIDATTVAAQAGVGRRINTVMQTCFFALSGLMPQDEAIQKIKDAIRKSYGKQGDEVVRRNIAAVDAAIENMHRVRFGDTVTSESVRPPSVPHDAPDFVKRVTSVMMEGRGDLLPVSAFPPDGTWPTATTRFERRSIATSIPIWDSSICIQCNKCSLVCPHAAIRAKAFEPEGAEGAPDSFRCVEYKAKDLRGLKYTIQVAPDDCTGCRLCVNVCPAKDKASPKRRAINMEPMLPLLEAERANFEHFLEIPQLDREKVVRLDVKGSQFLRPLFEFSGACAGCGETPYIKLLTQLFGDRMVVANATGCSSIYGGNMPTTPYCVDDAGRGPAWSNSLFEDNAEFGLGMKLATDALADQARALVRCLSGTLGDELVTAILDADQRSEAGLREQRERVAILRERLHDTPDAASKRLVMLADYLVRKSQWIIGGDGWAFDIGYGGLDHVLAQPHDVNI